jgi:hypothetical protein
MIGGNRVRFQRSVLTLRADDEWRTKMSLSKKAIAAGLTLPLLAAYGYLRPARFGPR